MKKVKVTLAAVLALGVSYVAAACGGEAQLDVRTFELKSLQSSEAAELISPYVYRDREGAAGMISTMEGALTVRESADNLAKIERVLEEYDRSRSDVRLHFQIIEANGFTDSDASIAEVEQELRKIFQFRGYRLAGEGVVSATDGSSISQAIQGPDDLYEISGEVYWTGPNTIRLHGISLYSQSGQTGLSTGMNIRPGQTLILGSSPKVGTTGTLLLTVRAEEVTPSNQ